MSTKTQGSLNAHLTSVGADPVDAIWGSMLDIIYLMPRFIELGGAYSNATSILTRPYPIPTMLVSYRDNWLHLTRAIENGYPVIRLVGRESPPDTQDYIRVHPDHLDTALIYLLEIPDNAE